LADYLVSIQCTDDGKLAYGGFQSKDGSNYYYSIDVMRAIPALLKAYALTGNASYLDSAVLAGETFLYIMQHQPSILGVHDQYYGGFAQAVTLTDTWLPEMHIIDLYGLISLKMLYEQTSQTQIQAMINDALGFYRSGFENLCSRYSPDPSGDGEWQSQRIRQKILVRRRILLTLDRDTAKIVAFNIQKIAREEGRAIFAATTHTDLFEDLKPSVHIHKRFGREIKVNYYPNNINKECSIVKEMRIEKGTKADYKQLAHFHYQDSRLFAHHKIFTMKRNDETVGTIVYASPPSP